ANRVLEPIECLGMHGCKLREQLRLELTVSTLCIVKLAPRNLMLARPSERCRRRRKTGTNPALENVQPFAPESREKRGVICPSFQVRAGTLLGCTLESVSLLIDPRLRPIVVRIMRLPHLFAS